MLQCVSKRLAPYALAWSVVLAPGSLLFAQAGPAPTAPGPGPAQAEEPAAPVEPGPAQAEPAAPVEPGPAQAEEPATPVEPNSLPAAPIEVTVVGTHIAKTPGAVAVVRGKELERFEYDDPTAVLTAVPGVYSRTEDGMGLRPNIGMRGVNPDRSKKVTLMEDGVLFGPAPYSAPAAYYFPIITRMSQVRVIKGPAAVAYGPQTVGGAIDLVTRAIPTRPAGGLDLALGQFGYVKGHGYFGASTDQFGFVLEGIHLENSGFKELPDGSDTGFARNEWMAKFAYVIDPGASVRHEFRAKLGYSDEVSNETYLGLSNRDFKQDPYRRYGASSLDRMKNHRFATTLTHQVDVSPRMSLTTTAYRHVFSRAWRRVDGFEGQALFDLLTDREPLATSETPEEQERRAYLEALRGRGELQAAGDSAALLIATNARDFVSEGVESRYRWDTETGATAHRLELGLRLHYDRIERRHTADAFDLLRGEPFPQNRATQVTTFNKGATYALSPQIMYAVTLGGLTLTPGLRAELMRMSFVNRATGEGVRSFDVAVLPGLGLYYALTDHLGLLAGVYRGFSPVPPESSEDADPETSINYEAGTRFTQGALRGELVGFFNDYNNLTNYCTASGGGCAAQDLDRQSSAGRARIYGVEALAAHEVAAGPVKVPLSLSYTFTIAEFRQTFQSFDPSWGSVQKGDAIPYVPSHQARASAGVESKPAGGALAFTYVAATSEGNVGAAAERRIVENDAQLLFDASGWAKVWGPFQVYATVQNLLDSTYLVARRPFGARPNAPRWIHVGAKAVF